MGVGSHLVAVVGVQVARWHRHWLSVLGLAECVRTWRWSSHEGGALWAHICPKRGSRAQWHEDRRLWDRPGSTAVATGSSWASLPCCSDGRVIYCYRERLEGGVLSPHVGRTPGLRDKGSFVNSLWWKCKPVALLDCILEVLNWPGKKSWNEPWDTSLSLFFLPALYPPST